jgi:hypothetical protein
MATLVAGVDCEAHVPVHVESQLEDYEALSFLYRRRVRNLTAIFELASGATWLERLLGVDDSGLLARLDGSILLAHCETALLEEGLSLCDGDFDSHGLIPEQFEKRIAREIKDLEEKPKRSEWKRTSTYLRKYKNAAKVSRYCLFDMFLQHEVCLASGDELVSYTDRDSDFYLNLARRLGYTDDWFATHDGTVPDDLAAHFRLSFHAYFTLRDDWISERPAALIDPIRPELNRRVVAVPMKTLEHALKPSRATVHLPLPSRPRESASGKRLKRLRHRKLQLLLPILGSTRPLVFNEMLAFVSQAELRNIVSGGEELSASLCRYIENFLQLEPGWFDHADEGAEATPLQLLQPAHGLPTFQLNVLNRSEVRRRSKREALPDDSPQQVATASEDTELAPHSDDTDPGQPESTAPATTNLTLPATSSETTNARRPNGTLYVVPRQKLNRLSKYGRPVGGLMKHMKLSPSDEPAGDTPAQIQNAETWRKNLVMMTQPTEAAQILAKKLGWSLGNVTKRLNGQIKITAQDADFLEETFQLQEGWMQELHVWSDLPMKAQKLLSGKLSGDAR